MIKLKSVKETMQCTLKNINIFFFGMIYILISSTLRNMYKSQNMDFVLNWFIISQINCLCKRCLKRISIIGKKGVKTNHKVQFPEHYSYQLLEECTRIFPSKPSYHTMYICRFLSKILLLLFKPNKLFLCIMLR